MLGIMALTGFAVIQPDPISAEDDLTYVDQLPIQSETSLKKFRFKGYTIKPLADFTIEAKVLNYMKYDSDKESELSPIDLALGWGPMSRERVISEINISQKGRWYFWQTDNFPVPRKDIEFNSANMHMIPATDDVKTRLMRVRKGDIVRFNGILVECIQKNWRWKSSLTREDTGNGACEVIYVTDFTVIPVEQLAIK